MAYILLIWLVGAGPSQFWHERVYETQVGCFRQAMLIEALDPTVERTQCVPYNDPVPGNIG